MKELCKKNKNKNKNDVFNTCIKPLPSFQLYAPSAVLLLYVSEQWPCDIIVFLFGCCVASCLFSEHQTKCFPKGFLARGIGIPVVPNNVKQLQRC